MNCISEPWQRNMAKNIKATRFMKEIHSMDRPSVRRTPPRPAGLYLLELRSKQVNGKPLLQKRKLLIRIDSNCGEDGQPEPVKITFT